MGITNLRDFDIFAPKGGGGKNYKKLGYDEMFQISLSDGDLDQSHGMNYLWCPQYNDVVIRSNGNITMPMISIKDNNNRFNGVATFNIENGQYLLSKTIGQISDNRNIPCKKEFSNGRLLMVRPAKKYYEIYNENGTFVSQYHYAGQEDTYEISNSTHRGCMINDYIYVFNNRNNLVRIDSTPKPKYMNVTTKHPSGGGSQFQLINHKGYLYTFSTNSDDWTKYDVTTNIDNIRRISMGKLNINGLYSNRRFVSDGEFIYCISYEADYYSTSLIKLDDNLNLVSKKLLSGKLGLSFFSEIFVDNDSIYVKGYAYMDIRMPSKQSNLLKVAVMKFDKNLQETAKCMSGFSSYLNKSFIDVKNGIIISNRYTSDSSNSSFYLKRTPIIATMENILSKKDLVKELRK